MTKSVMAATGSRRRSLTKRKVREGFPEEVTTVAAGVRPEGYAACGGSGDLQGTKRDQYLI